MSYIWPIALVVAANTAYQICAKSVPESIHPMAALTVTYAVAAAASLVLYFVMNQSLSLGRLQQDLGHINWASIVLGVVIVGLEVGFIYAYRAGWQVSTASTVSNGFLAVAVMIVGLLLFGEKITLTKAAGVAVVMAGLYLINK